MTDIKPGDFGIFTFILRSKQGIGGPHTISGAEVIETDRWYVQIQDMEGNMFLPRRDDIQSFIPQKKIINELKN